MLHIFGFKKSCNQPTLLMDGKKLGCSLIFCRYMINELNKEAMLLKHSLRTDT